MYTDFHLRFPDQQTALEALCLAFGDDSEGVPLHPEPGALDIIGHVFRDDTPEGEAPAVRPGYLVNVRLASGLPTALAAYAINAPENPVRVWA